METALCQGSVRTQGGEQGMEECTSCDQFLILYLSCAGAPENHGFYPKQFGDIM